MIILGADIILTKNEIEVDRLLTNPNDIIGKLNNTFLSTVVIIFIIVASCSTNLIANYIPSQNILINFFRKIYCFRKISFLFVEAIFGLFLSMASSKLS